LVEYLKHVPTRFGTDAKVVVREISGATISLRTPDRVVKWMTSVHDPYISGMAERADSTWRWNRIAKIVFGVGALRKPRMLQLCARGSNFPLGMVAILENERWPGDPRKPAVFVWYLSAAPPRAVMDQGGQKALTAATLDIAVTISLNGPAEGRLWLHAAPAGGETLMDYYLKRGLEPIPRNAIIPGSMIAPRDNDGRYFKLTEESAITLSQKMEKYRV